MCTSLCIYSGFTKQYTELQELYEKYKDRGFAVVGFPCNQVCAPASCMQCQDPCLTLPLPLTHQHPQFGSQEPGTDAEIQEFACSRFKVSFPLTSKVDVNGDEAHPLFKWLKHEKRGIFGTEGIKWNFTKFLVDRAGEPVHRYAPTTTPSSIEKDILPLLE